jgi:(S)-3,5-dihydroxyphenylglycine transaminase
MCGNNGGTTVSLRSDLSHGCMGIMNFLNEATYRFPQAVSFAAGRPPDRFVSAEQTGAWISRFVNERVVSSKQSEAAVWLSLGQYGPTNGVIGDLIARLLERDEGMRPDPAALMVTNGMQEAVLMLLLGICNGEQDAILSDDPAYVGLMGAATLARVPVVPLPVAGTVIERAERALASVKNGGRRARALYLIPDFSNPLGTTLTLAERHELLAFAKREQMLLIEDTAYRAFRYEGETLPSLKALDQDGVVVQVGSFSKLFMPGPRVGYLYADQWTELNGVSRGETLAQALSKVKSFVSVLTSPSVQAMVGGFLLEHDCNLDGWNRPRIEACRLNRDALLKSMDECIGGDALLADRVTWTRPEGGFFIAITLPFAFHTDEMMKCARDYGVIVCPMSYFSSQPEFSQQIRLSFSNATPEQAHEGITRLSRFIRDEVVRRAC